MSTSESEKKKEEPPKRVIPKFSSFKPVPAPAPALVTRTPAPTASKAVEKDRSSKGKERESQDKHRRRHHRSSSRSRDRRHRKDDAGRDRDRGKTDDEHRRRHRDGSRERSHRHRNANEVSHRRRKTRSPSPKKSSSLIPRASAPRSPTPESWDAPKKQYYVDTKGDDNNLVYGTIHRYSIPDYRRGGSGSIVGLPPNVKIDKEKGDGKGLVLSTGGRGKEGSSMKAMRQAFSRLASKDTKRLRVRKEETGLEEAFSRGVDFVPLSITTKKRKSRSDGSDESDDNYEDHYRSILGLKKSSEAPADKDLEYASESQSEGDYIATEEWGDRKRMVELVRKVDAEPKNIDAWMAYVNHHDNMVSATGRRKTAAEKRSIAEVKLDILQKGLEKNPGNERLLLRHMEVAEEIWDSKKLLEKWKSILKDNPAIVSLWTKYINFRQTDFLSFTYPECLKCFSESLLVLRSAAFKTDTRSPTREALDEVILYVFTRTILLMDEAGYKENAIAALQAMLELNLFAPPNILPPSSIREFETIIEHVEKFWDSEVPRIGEENALGWAAFVTSGEEGNPPDPVEEELQLPPLDPKNPFGSWTNAEVEWSRKIGMPARTIDEVEEDDPYRVILFSDLKDFMFYFSSERIRKKMVEAFLVLKNLPPLTPHSSNGAIMEDMFLRSGLSKLGEDDLESWFWPKTQGQSDALAITWEGMEPEKKAAMGNPFEYKLRNFPVGCENVFSKSAGWFDGIEPLKLNRKEATGFVRNTLKTLVESVEDESLALYYLAWEWAQVKAQNNIKKVAKALLKRFKTSLRLWSAFAQIEWHNTGPEVGRNVFSMALGMSKEFSETSRADSIILWHSWIWEELLSGNIQAALRLVLSIDAGKPLDEAQSGSVGPGEISGALLLKTRRFLEDQQDTMVSIRSNEHAGVFNDLRALLEYLATGTNLDAAVEVYDAFIGELARRSLTGPDSPVHEICLLRKSRLLYLHSTTAKPFKPATLRLCLETSLSVFPQNSAFLSLFTWNEARTKIENRVRTVIRDRVLAEGGETVIGWLFAIWAELRMGVHFNVHAVRSLFERAVECSRTKSSPALWALFVEFEMRQRDGNRARNTLMRGIRNCPWSKDLILMAFTKLGGVLDFEEYRKLLSIMAQEKELRVHDVTELEDLLEDMESAGGGQRQEREFIKLPDDSDTDEEMVDE